KNNEILINDFGQTSNEKIYAAGDVTLGPQFVYVAAYEGGIITDNAIGGLNKKIDLSVVPAVTFTNPTVATVGLTEEQAKEKGRSEEHTTELQSRFDLVCRLLLEKKK